MLGQVRALLEWPTCVVSHILVLCSSISSVWYIYHSPRWISYSDKMPLEDMKAKTRWIQEGFDFIKIISLVWSLVWWPFSWHFGQWHGSSYRHTTCTLRCICYIPFSFFEVAPKSSSSTSPTRFPSDLYRHRYLIFNLYKWQVRHPNAIGASINV